MIDHLRNTAAVALDGLEILVLDEADRLLEMGFAEELEELLKYCPKRRQTLLFSATMTEEVDRLVKLSLNKPVRVSVDPLFDMSAKLVQEFVRIRSNMEKKRGAMLLALCKHTYRERVIIFFDTKWMTHRMMLLFGLAGIPAAELHGNLTQPQREESLERFRSRRVEFLLCTDLAARGLDVAGVQTVINFSMPTDITRYVHRAGRTARAGRRGVCVTLTGEKKRLLMKRVMRRAKPENVRGRAVAPERIERWQARIERMEGDVADIIAQEKMEREIRKGAMQAEKLENLVKHEDEIKSRPARTWHASAKEKQAMKAAALEAEMAARAAASAEEEKAAELEVKARINKGDGLSSADREMLRLSGTRKRKRAKARKYQSAASKAAEAHVAKKQKLMARRRKAKNKIKKATAD
eukprot:PLAT14065.1.p1 GENE.PLAT14065.1~~PLAT14065.1.p1  ORF type:complete len:440 (-),score=218.63 PLAT14065.1:67-1296(-)